MIRPNEMKRSVATSSPELSRAQFMGRRLLRPKTYPQAWRAARDTLIGWPQVRAKVSAVAEQRGSDFTVVQVGANDGVQFDPISRMVGEHTWQGLLLEPVPRYFAALQRTYEGRSNVQLARVAIDETAGSKTMMAVNPMNDTDSRLSGCSTFHSEVLDRMAWLSHDVSRLVEPIEVPTQTLSQVLAGHAISRMDLLIVDTEGHDAVVVNQALDLEQTPSLILFERGHLPADTRAALQARLATVGYAMQQLRLDTFCWQPGAEVT